MTKRGKDLQEEEEILLKHMADEKYDLGLTVKKEKGRLVLVSELGAIFEINIDNQYEVQE